MMTFLNAFRQIGCEYYVRDDGIEFWRGKNTQPISLETDVHPGFMTDWQASWAVLMTQAQGESIIHETVFSNRFGYVKELKKMGAHIVSYDPDVADPESAYNFDIDEKSGKHAIKITGPSNMHNAILSISDLRAGASLVIAALAATGETTIHGVHLIDRGYEKFVDKLVLLGANVVRTKDTYTE
jgi:UDP-N-acetylglucosamine 1-carboxyvinyltransferase